MKRILLVCFLVCAVAFQSYAQERTISGTVLSDEDNAGLPAVNIIVKGTTQGTTTDLDGNYKVSVPSGDATLVFSSIGFQNQEIIVGDQSVINLTLLSDITQLGEVVVTALGISREKAGLGYAVQQVEGEDLEKSQQTDVISALSGRVAGVQINQSSNIGGSKRITIRGASSFFGENQPLIVIDGLPVSNSNFNAAAMQSGSGGFDYGNMLNDINPDDVESISVLKGTAAALYGSRAANGVILITTKKGNAGKSSFTVDVNSAVNFENAYVMPDLQNKYGGGAIVSDANGGVDGFEQVEIEGQNYLVPAYGVDESWGPRYDPSIMVLPWNAFSQDYPDEYLQQVPWVATENDVDEFFETGTSFVNSIFLTGTTENAGVRIGFTNTTSGGILPGSDLKKNNITVGGNMKMFDKLTVTANLNYLRTTTQGRPLLGYPASGQRYGNTLGQTFWQWVHRQIDYKVSKGYKNADGTQRSWNRNSWDDPTPHYSDNHHWIAYENRPEDERNRVFGNLGLSYELTPGLEIGGRVSGDIFTFEAREKVAVGSQAQSSFYKAVRTFHEFNSELTLKYSKEFNNDLNLNAVVGGNQMRQEFELTRGETSGGLVVPNLYNLLNSAGNVLVNDITDIKRINSVFASANIGFRNMLYLDLTARNDWSSTLPEDNNSYFYPSASLSFVFSETVQLPWLDFGKVRFGVARVSKDTDPYRVETTYRFNSDGTFQGTPRIFAPDELLNANLKPENTDTWEAGFEASLFNNRLGIDFTYFNNTTTDQIIPLEVSKSTGYNAKFINAGEIENKGIELTLTGTPVRVGDFAWDIMVNYTKIDNEVIEILEGIDAMDIATAPFSGVFLRASVGSRYGQLWGYDFVRDDQGNRVVLDNGYWARTPNLVPLGSVMPDWNMGIRNAFTYKGFDLSVLFDIQQGGKFYSVSHMWGHYSGIWEETAQVNDQGNEIRSPVSEGGGILLDGVKGVIDFNEDGSYTVSNTTPNDTYVSGQGWAARHYHGFGFPSAQSVFDADYIKMREVTLGYDFDVTGIEFLRNVRFSVYGRNLLVFGLDHDGLDPEITVNGSGNIQGIEAGFIPQTRSYGFKLQLGF